MFFKKAARLTDNAVTPESVYLRRREFMGASAALLASTAASASLFPFGNDDSTADNLKALRFTPASAASNQGFYTAEPLTPFADVTGYNNFYEFGTDKGDPARYASEMSTDPWSVEIVGEIAKPGSYPLEDILTWVDLEERIYRLRCVEAWSMVIPWIGFPLAALIKRVEPTSKAKFLQFETLYRPEEMRGQRSRFSTIEWPYIEGLRMDEAMHPLTILSVGLYGKVLPNQNGAPIRLVVPWKYGFKSIKSVVRIRFVEKQPATSWNNMQPNEYGFYANVNPDVDHPRWSQKTERRLPSTLLSPNRIDTQFLNGYADEVAQLYQGMDLTRNY